jgi:hypothetical protein
MRCTRCHQDYGSPYKYANKYGHSYSDAYVVGQVVYTEGNHKYTYRATEKHYMYVRMSNPHYWAYAKVDGKIYQMSNYYENNKITYSYANILVDAGDHSVELYEQDNFRNMCRPHGETYISKCTRKKCKNCGYTYDTWNPSY